ncbi:30S ribosomal protein S1 [Engelhardtia mirabilis]|uniref:30S ribosomal protein S1 n=1 Tax=Engelhardtia mirabilis TaxID=2528011 RepID=A0A518BFV3_9BACT|nr:30S ribosomal protein S1 [Planctomycetes bacterium Pla133]QDV00181.1 30S ribosomal protein S1 [Planctomycetes bacterium Pla86]
MTPKPPSERDPVDADLEAALADVGSLLDIDLDPTPSQVASSKGSKSKAGAGRRGRSEDDLVKGKIAGVSGDDVIVEIGPRMQGVIDAGEFDAPPTEGEVYEFTMHGQKDGLWLLSRRRARALAAWNDVSVGSHVEGMVSAVNSGGLEVQIGPLHAFMPASQASGGHVEDLSTLVGQKLVVEVMEVDPGKKRFVVSRRKVLERERASLRDQIVGHLHPGDDVQGKVSRIETFGAFVDLGGVDGLVHVSQISRKRVDKVDEVLKVGDVVQAKVLEVKEGGKRISLSMKALEPDPWDDAAMRFADDTVIEGTVTRLQEFGAFVEIAPGLDGLLHVSQILGGGQRVNRPGDVLKVGEKVTVRVQSVDSGKRRISLTRLDERGAILGSEEAVDAAELDQLVKEKVKSSGPLGTNLGNLFKKALGDK